MVPPSKKRKLPAASGPAAKRNKNQAASKVVKSKPKPKPTKKSAAPRIVDAASLSWQSVGEEDFGGLEVIGGVEVVRDGGKVQFVVKQQQQQQQTQTQTQAEEEDGKQDGEEESFEGFGDDAVGGQDVDPHQDCGAEDGVEGARSGEKTAGKNKTKTKAKTKARQAATTTAEKALQNPAARNNDNGKGNANAFSALAGIADGEEGDGDEGVDVADWVALNLSPRILSAIAKLGFAKPTAIQKKSIPEIVAGGDVIGKAQTGSGKTLAFGIPIVEKWLEMHESESDEQQQEAKKRGPMAVVLSPTRELAKQLGDHLKALCDGLPTAPYVCVVTGGLSIHKQQRQLEKADIVIGTPGRLWEVLDGDMKLQDAFTHIKFLVVDEADRLFKVGQFKEAENIIGALDRRDPEAERGADDDGDDELPPRQTLVFSATFDKDLQTKLAGRSKSSKGSSAEAGGDDDKMAYLMKCLQFRSEPQFIDVNPVSRMAEGLKEGLIECGAMEKDLYLYTVLLLNPNRRTLVFTNSISAVRRLTPLLQNLQLAVLPLHSQMAQKARHRSLERFTASRSSVLVATDVAARGLDIHAVDQVVHYHVPRSADTYIHRSGRTARGERSGVSIILCSPDEVISTRRLAAKVHAKRAASGSSSKRQHDIQMLPLDRKIASRLKPRVDLSKRIADAVLAKEKGHSDDQWLRGAAEDLGVEYDEDEFEDVSAGGWGAGGRGGGRRRKEKIARALTKAEMGALKGQLREELGRRVNLGVSEKYITGGRVDVGALLRERENASGGMGIFLGGDSLGLGLGL
ncbi:ATP-dependent RNA helicase MAK5 [Tolypocladium ophioglossoides CBS 100239]|uniref:RNA helicase n=1 Tax=Tolypocladium ophioglossoides (strain CBS 100239) TaxID=1163406 RepID=A0A0L0N3I6_TOLOC|nr:ATP-dependent RNA helicase MAK5 [Tolypocladium ophioglossoides CBS 100239]